MFKALVSRVQVAPFELSIGLLLALSGFRFLWKREELYASQIGQSLFLPELWAAGFMASGFLIIVGLLKPSPRVEASGLCLMASVVTVNSIAFAVTYNIWEQWQYGVAFVFYLSLLGAALARLHVLLTGYLIHTIGTDGRGRRS